MEAVILTQLLLSTALAGYYHPTDVASASVAYQRASEQAASAAGTAQRQSRSLAAATVEFEETLDLLGARAPAAQRARAKELQRSYNRSFAVLQAFADELIGDFDAAFGSALTRALAAHPGAVRCQARLAKGPRLPGMRGRTQKNPDCKGEALNEDLARALDADPILQAALTELEGRQWPGFALPIQPVDPVGGTSWVSAPEFFHQAMPDALRTIRLADEDARLDFAVAIESGATPEELTKLRAEAAKIDAHTAQRRADLAEPVLARAAVVLTKKAAGAGWCAQPDVFGGCSGIDVSKAAIPLLLADKKLQRALP